MSELEAVTSAALSEIDAVQHGFFTRLGGVSQGIYAALNCGFGSGDERADVAENRRRVAALWSLPGERLITGYQVHGRTVADAATPWSPEDAPQADGLVCDRPGVVLGILTADCAPVLLADPTAGVIGAAHAGWKGALSGVVEAVIDAMVERGAQRDRISAAIGPCIAQSSYEVGAEFVASFTAAAPTNADFFTPSHRPGHSQFDLPGYLAARLRPLSLRAVTVAGLDTAGDADRFFSYRRTCLAGEKAYGRLVSAITLV